MSKLLQGNFWPFWVAIALIFVSHSSRADFKADQAARGAAYVEYDTWLEKNRGASQEEREQKRKSTIGAAEKKFQDANRAEYDQQTQRAINDSLEEQKRIKAMPKKPSEPLEVPKVIGHKDGMPIFEMPAKHKAGASGKNKATSYSGSSGSSGTADAPSIPAGGRGGFGQSTGISRPEFSLDGANIPKEIEFDGSKSKPKAKPKATPKR